MIGKINCAHREVTVVGAGISGLLAAYHLDRAEFKVTLIEESERVGGLISTTQTRYGIAESAAHSFLVTSPVRSLCEDLGIALTPVNPKARPRYILRSGRARRFPLTLYETAVAAFRALTVKASKNSITMEDWALRHLGPGARDYLISPFLLGIHAALPSEINVDAAFPKFNPGRGKTLIGSLIEGRMVESGRLEQRAKIMAPTQGMGALVAALEQRLDKRMGKRFQRGTAVKTLPDSPNLVLAVPAPVAARLLVNHDTVLADELRKIVYTPLVSVSVFIPTSNLGNDIEGMGILIPGCEGRRVLGVLFNSSTFPGRVNSSQHVSFTVVLGGLHQPDFCNLTNDAIEQMVNEELAAIFHIKASPAHMQIHRWQRALPLYSTRLSQTWQTARDGWCSRPGRVLSGNYTGQISIRGMIEEIASMTKV